MFDKNIQVNIGILVVGHLINHFDNNTYSSISKRCHCFSRYV